MIVYLSSQKGHVGRYFYKYLKKQKNIKVIQHDKLNLFDEIDIFIHTGASTPPKSILKLFYSNVIRNIHLLNILKKKKIRKFFFLSTISVYGNINNKKINENTLARKTSFYGYTKKWGENFFLKNLDCDVICLRLPAILTKGNTKHLLGKLYDDLKKGKVIKLKNYDKIYNSFISAKNLIDFIFFKELNFKKDIINLGIENKYELFEIVKLIKKKIKSNSKVLIDKSKANHFTIDISKSTKKYYFKPYSLEKTIKAWLN